MHRMVFQFGPEFEANQRVDTWFARAIEALNAPAPAMTPVYAPRKSRTRLEARLAALSR